MNVCDSRLPKSAVFTGGLDHAEGIALAADGTVYAGGEAGQRYRICADGQNTTELARTGGFILGITLDRGVLTRMVMR